MKLAMLASPSQCLPFLSSSQLRWYDRATKMPRLEDSHNLDTPPEDALHYVNLANSYHHALPFSGNAPLTGNDVTIKQEYHGLSPSRTNGDIHNSTSAAYPVGE